MSFLEVKLVRGTNLWESGGVEKVCVSFSIGKTSRTSSKRQSTKNPTWGSEDIFSLPFKMKKDKKLKVKVLKSTRILKSLTSRKSKKNAEKNTEVGNLTVPLTILESVKMKKKYKIKGEKSELVFIVTPIGLGDKSQFSNGKKKFKKNEGVRRQSLPPNSQLAKERGKFASSLADPQSKSRIIEKSGKRNKSDKILSTSYRPPLPTKSARGIKRSGSSSDLYVAKKKDKILKKKDPLTAKRKAKDQFALFMLHIITILKDVTYVQIVSEKKLKNLQKHLNPTVFLIQQKRITDVELAFIDEELKKYQSVLTKCGYKINTVLTIEHAQKILAELSSDKFLYELYVQKKSLMMPTFFKKFVKKDSRSRSKSDNDKESVNPLDSQNALPPKKEAQIQKKMHVDEMPIKYKDLKNPKNEIFIGTYTGMVCVKVNTNILIPVGLGKLEFPNKEFCYEGYFSEGKKNGYGKIYRVSNVENFLKGSWKNNVPYGECQFRYANGDLYLGRIKCKKTKNVEDLKLSDIMKEGFGKFVSRKHGYLYYGDFKNDKRHGMGIKDNLKTGERYIGNWRGNLFNGNGCFSYLDGSLFSGNFQNGKKHLVGKYLFSNGYSFKGSWSKNKIEKIMENEGGPGGHIQFKYSEISETIRKMIESEILRNKSFSRVHTLAVKEKSLYRSNLLWSNLVNMKRIESELSNMDSRNIYELFDRDLLLSLINNQSSYLRRTLEKFCDYFVSIYSYQFGSSKKGQILRNQLLYANDDLKSFLEFVKMAFFSVLNKFNRDAQNSSSSSSSGSGDGGFFSGSNSRRNPFSDAKDIFYAVSKSKGESNKSKVSHHQNIITYCFSEFIHQRIYKILFSLYQAKYNEEQIIFNQKIVAIKYALSTLSIEKKLKLLQFKLERVKKNEGGLGGLGEVEVIDGMKHLLQSLVDDTNKEEKGEKAEMNFLKCFLSSMKKKIEKLDEGGPKRGLTENEFFDISKLKFEKNFLVSLENFVKKIRINLKTSNLSEKLDKISTLLPYLIEKDNLSSLGAKNLEDLPKLTPLNQISFKNQIKSVKYGLQFLVELMDSEDSNFDWVKEHEIHIESLSMAIQSILYDFDYYFNQSISQNILIKKSVNFRINSVVKILKSVMEKDYDIIFSWIQSTKTGNFKDIQLNSGSVKSKLADLFGQNSENKAQFEFILERWNSINAIHKSRTKLSSIGQLLNINLQLNSVKKQLHFLSNRIQSVSNPLKSLIKRMKSVIADVKFLSNSAKIAENSTVEFYITNFKTRVQSIGLFLKILIGIKTGSEVHVDLLFSFLRNFEYFYKNLILQLKNLKINTLIESKIKQEEKKIKILGKGNEQSISFQKRIHSLEEFKTIVFNQSKLKFEQLKIIKTLKTFELGVKSIQMKLEKNEIESDLTKITRKLVIKEVSKNLEMALRNINQNCIRTKLESLQFGIRNLLESSKKSSNSTNEIGTNLTYIQLELLGVGEKYVPKDHNLIPYLKCIKKMDCIKEKNSANQKIKILRELELLIFEEMKETSQKSVFDEDDILPIFLYILLQSKIDHFAEYNYLNDYDDQRNSIMLTRFSIFFKYVQNLDPYARGSEKGEMLSVIGNIINPIKNTIFKLINSESGFQGMHSKKISRNIIPDNTRKGKINLSWLISLFNYIYCEVGFMGDGEKILEVKDVGLKNLIVKNFENVQFILSGKNIGFSLIIDEEFEDKLLIEFENIYNNPRIYKYCAEELLKEFKDYSYF